MGVVVRAVSGDDMTCNLLEQTDRKKKKLLNPLNPKQKICFAMFTIKVSKIIVTA